MTDKKCKGHLIAWGIVLTLGLLLSVYCVLMYRSLLRNLQTADDAGEILGMVILFIVLMPLTIFGNIVAFPLETVSLIFSLQVATKTDKETQKGYKICGWIWSALSIVALLFIIIYFIQLFSGNLQSARDAAESSSEASTALRLFF